MRTPLPPGEFAVRTYNGFFINGKWTKLCPPGIPIYYQTKTGRFLREEYVDPGAPL